MATTGAELALDTGKGGDMRFLLPGREAVRAAMRKQTSDPGEWNAVLYMNAPHTRKLRLDRHEGLEPEHQNPSLISQRTLLGTHKHVEFSKFIAHPITRIL